LTAPISASYFLLKEAIMAATIRIEDVAIWFKHVREPGLRERLAGLAEDESIFLEANGVVGRWRRMRQGKNPKPTEAIKPDGKMTDIWGEWFRTLKGTPIQIREVTLADDYLAEGSLLFSEWNSPGDEEAFRDL
jgi:hypothetical protein